MALILSSILLLGLPACNGGVDEIPGYDDPINYDDDDDDMTIMPNGSEECTLDPDGQPSAAVRAAWLGHPQSHARFHCYAACIPGQTRSANCQILRDYPTSDGITADRRCTYCG